MKILFLNPVMFYSRWPIPVDFCRFVCNHPSVTFPQLASMLPDRHEIEFVDGFVEKMDRKDLERKAVGKDIIAISTNTASIALNVELNIIVIKKVNPTAKIILGGLHPTLYYEEWLEKGADFVVRGEGEISFKELVKSIEQETDLKSVKGISYRTGDKIINNPDRDFIENLDDLPMPKWDILNFDMYGNKNFAGKTCTIETSRGCLYKCDFCVVSSVWKQTQRFKTVNRVIKELIQLKKRGVKRVFFSDDNFGCNYRRDMQIMDEIIKNNIEMDIYSFTRADYIYKYPDFYELAARAGLRCVLVGFETLNRKKLFDVGKSYASYIGSDEYKKIYETLKRNRIFTIGLFIIGYMGETPEDIKYNLNNYKKICDFPLFSPFRPEKGTRAYKKIKESLPEEIFYYDSITRLSDFDRYNYLRHIQTFKSFFRPIMKIFTRDEFQRKLFINLYRYLLYWIFHINMTKFIDFLYIFLTAKKGINYKNYKRKIVEKYMKEYS